MQRMVSEFDTIILGGGMVGASLARSLAGAGLRIAVVEAWPLDSGRQPSYDDRAIALAYGTRLILQGMGLWSTLQPQVEPIRHIHVSNRGHFGFTRLHSADHELDALGYVATGRALGELLLAGLDRVQNLELFCPAELNSFQVQEHGVEVVIALQGKPRKLRGRLLVAADGVNSKVREGVGIGVREWSYGQSAVISNITPESPPNGTAYERFTETGPIAMLPLTEGRYGLVWTLAEQEVKEVLALDDAAFLARLQQSFGQRLGRLERAGRRSAYPLKLLQAKEHIRPRVALIGNAAHAVHPITGQGFNLGIRDVAVLAEVLSDAIRQGRDPGALETLEEYARWRRRDQQLVALMTDGLVRLFTNPLPPIGVLRNLGLLALDLVPPAKRALARRFMGLNGRLPRLSRGLPID